MGGKVKFAPVVLLLIIASSVLVCPTEIAAANQQGGVHWLYPCAQYGGEVEQGGIKLQFSGYLTTSGGSCQQVAPNVTSCQLPTGTQGIINLTATRTPAGAVNIRAHSLPAGWPAFQVASGWGTITRGYAFTVPTGSAGKRFELVFRAWTAGVPQEIELKCLIDATAPPSPAPTTPPPPTYPTPPAAPAIPKVPRIQVEPISLDFGEVPVATTTERQFTIRNVGEVDLWINAVNIQGGTRSPFDLCGRMWSPYPLPPGSSINPTLCFSPKAGGIFKDQVIVQSGDPANPSIRVTLEGKASKKKSTISCNVMVRAKPGGKLSLHQGGRETEVLVMVTLSPARSADYTAKISDPGGREHGPFNNRTDAAGKDKKVVPVWAGGVTGDISGTWKVEVSWKGDEEYEGASSHCEFTVGKLGSYEGTEAGPSTSALTRSPNKIDVTYNGFCSDNCAKIVFIQVFSDAGVFKDGHQWLKPSETGSAFNFLDADAQQDVSGQWFTVDHLRNENDPYYNGDDSGDTGAEPGKARRWIQGEHDGTSTATTMSDAPRYSNTAFSRLETSYGKEVTRIVTYFETFAFCVEGRDKGKFYQGIRWKYQQEKGKAGTSTIDEVVYEPSQGFKAALDKWCTNHGFALPK